MNPKRAKGEVSPPLRAPTTPQPGEYALAIYGGPLPHAATTRMIQLMRAYRQYLRSAHRPAAAAAVVHRCAAGACTWRLISRDHSVYLCASSGNLHQCSRVHCDRLVHEVDADICELTGYAYDAWDRSPVAAAAAANEGEGEEEEEEEDEKTENNGEDSEEEKEEEDEEEEKIGKAPDPEPIPPPPTPEPHRAAGKRKRGSTAAAAAAKIAEDPLLWLSRARGVAQTFIVSSSNPDDDRDDTALICMRLWVTIALHGAYTGARTVHVFEQHCKAIMALRSRGGVTRKDGTVIIPGGGPKYAIAKQPRGSATFTAAIAQLQRSLGKIDSVHFLSKK